jgi:YVTN family beta-propeller protein
MIRKIFVFAVMAAIICIRSMGISHAEVKAYVPSSARGSVTIFDFADTGFDPFDSLDDDNYTSPHVTVESLSLPFATAISRDGNYVYAVNRGSYTVSIINKADEKLVVRDGEAVIIGAGILGSIPYAIAVSPVEDIVYVVNNGSGTVSIIDTSDINNPVLEGTPVVGIAPNSIAVSPTGDYVYVVNSGDNTVSVIDTSVDYSGETPPDVPTISVGNAPFGIAIFLEDPLVPAGKYYICVTNSDDNTVSVIDSTVDYTGTFPLTITVGTKPYGIAVSPDGEHLYVANHDDDTLNIIETSSIETFIPGPSNTFDTGSSPYGVTVSAANADGNYFVYVGSQNNGSIAIDGTPEDTLSSTQYAGNMLQKPKELSIEVQSSYRIDLFWSYEHFADAVYSDLTGFLIERDFSGYALPIKTVGFDQTTYIHSDLRPTSEYSYRIRAYGKYGDLEYISIQEGGEGTTATLSKDDDCFIATAGAKPHINYCTTVFALVLSFCLICLAGVNQKIRVFKDRG